MGTGGSGHWGKVGEMGELRTGGKVHVQRRHCGRVGTRKDSKLRERAGTGTANKTLFCEEFVWLDL